MPFKSEKQRRYMFKKHPDIARRWSAEGKGYVEKSLEETGAERELFLDMGGSQVTEGPKRDLPIRDQTGRFVAIAGLHKHAGGAEALIFEKE